MQSLWYLPAQSPELLAIQIRFVFRMHGFNTLVKKAALCCLLTLLAKMRWDATALILEAVTSGSRTTSVPHCKVLKCLSSLFLFQALIVYKNHTSVHCIICDEVLEHKSQVSVLFT